MNFFMTHLQLAHPRPTTKSRPTSPVG